MQYDLNSLDNNLFTEYLRISESQADWCFFKNFVKNHSINSNDAITHEIISNIAQCRPPKPLNQDFFVPNNYTPPSDKFHKDLLSKIKNDDDNHIVITGSPGVGKSTYISYLKSELEKENIFVIRHHYYLSIETKENKRYRYFDIKNSLLEQINNIFSVSFSDRDELETVLNNTSDKLHGKQLVIIIDGLDHVWRDVGKKDDLDTLFNNLLPLPANIKLIIGTQPVDSNKLPHKLSSIERDKWLELPFMSIEAIQNYLVNDNRIQSPQDYHTNYYADISDAFFKLTNGHPLHLIYSLEYMINNASRLFPYDIERLAICPNNDIREYYRELLNTVDDCGRQVLYTFVVSEIELWKKNSLEECLTCNGITDATRYYKQVEHILFNDGFFVKAFHESIFAYIKEKISEDDKTKCLKYVQKWITEQAEEIYVDLYLPIINAHLGEYSKILDISKKQILKYFKKGYSLDLIAKFLAKAEHITFFELKDFVKTIELRHIETRIINLLDFNTYKAELFCSLHFDLYKNQDVINHLKSSINNLGVENLVILSDFCRDNYAQIDQIFKQIKFRHKSVSRDRKIEDGHLLYVISNSSKINNVMENCIENNYTSGLICLFNHMCAHKRTSHIKEFISEKTSDYSIIKRLCHYAINQHMDLSSWNLPEEYTKNPYLATMLYLSKKNIQRSLISLDNSIIQKRKMRIMDIRGDAKIWKIIFIHYFLKNYTPN